MTQEEKELLLKDLCARLPYGVKVSIYGSGAMELKSIVNSTIGWFAIIDGAPTDFGIDEIKPYLRPMSSMTDVEKEILEDMRDYAHTKEDYAIELVDFYNSHHLDFRNMIGKSLAIEAIERMYNIK